MLGLIELVSHFLEQNKFWAAPVFGLIAFGESTAVLGTIIPATPILFLMGTLVGDHRLNALPVLFWAILGAIGGYWLSWAVGRRIGHRLYQVRALKPHRRGIAQARLFFRNQGGPALIFGRFLLGPFQAMLPLVAGTAQMSPRRFHLWNLASSVTWVFVCLAPGYLTAKGLWWGGADPRITQGLGVVLALVSVGLVLLSFGGILWRSVTR